MWEVFEDLEVAYEHTSRACSRLAWLSCTLSGTQLMAALKATTQLLIQVNALKGFLDEPLAPRKADLPENKADRMKITMVPNPNKADFMKEKENSPTCLLVASFMYKVL